MGRHMLLRLAGALALVAAISAAASSIEERETDGLEQTRVCGYDQTCSFTAEISLLATDKPSAAETPDNEVFSLDLEVTSECGSKGMPRYRLDVTGAQGAQGARLTELKKYPAFFSQDANTGAVSDVLMSQNENRAVAKLKHGLVASLARTYRPGEQEYQFQGTDGDGEFVASHKASANPDSSFIAFVETAAYDDDEATSAVQRARKANFHVSNDGRILQLAVAHVVSLASEGQGGKPLLASDPNLGYVNTQLGLQVDRTSDAKNLESCAGSTDLAEDSDFVSYADAQLDGHFAKSLTAAWTPEELADTPADVQTSVSETAALEDEASALLTAGTFNTADLEELLSPQTAPKLLKDALALHKANSLSADNFQTVLAAAGGVKSAAVQQELAQLAANKGLSDPVRATAVLALLPAGETAQSFAPMAAIDTLGAVSQETGPVGDRATLVLGALLKNNMAASAKYTPVLEQRLAAYQPGSDAASHNAMVLIQALGNAGSSDAPQKFLSSNDARLRSAAVEALRFAHLDAVTSSLLHHLQSDPSPMVALAAKDVAKIRGLAKDDGATDELETTASGHGKVLDRTWPLASCNDLGVSAHASISLKGPEVLSTSALTANLLKNHVDLVHASSAGAETPEGLTAGVSVKMHGFHVHTGTTSKKVPATHNCPVDPKDVNTKKASFQETPALRKSTRLDVAPVSIGPGRVHVTASLHSRLGMSVLLQANKCDPTDPAATELLGGLAPHGTLGIRLSSKVDAYLAQAGVATEATLLDGDVPSYAVSSAQRTCGAALIGDNGLHSAVSTFTHKAGFTKDQKFAAPWTSKGSKAQLWNACVTAPVHAIRAKAPSAKCAGGIAPVVSKKGVACPPAVPMDEPVMEDDMQEGKLYQGKMLPITRYKGHHASNPFQAQPRIPGKRGGANGKGPGAAPGPRRPPRVVFAKPPPQPKIPTPPKGFFRKPDPLTPQQDAHGRFKAGIPVAKWIREAGRRTRKTVRNHGRIVIARTKQQSGVVRRQQRRLARQINYETNKNHAQLKQFSKKVKAQFGIIDDEKDQRKRNKAIRKERRSVKRSTKRLSAEMRRRLFRERARRIRKAEKKKASQIKKLLRRKQKARAERGQLKGLRKLEKRAFKRNKRQSNRNKLRRVIRRRFHNKRSAKRRFRKLGKKIKNRNSKARERRRFQRLDRRVRKDAKGGKKYGRRFAKLAAEEKRLGKNVNKNERKLQRGIRRRMSQEKKSRQERRDLNKVKKTLGRAAHKAAQARRAAGLRRTIGRDTRRARKVAARGASKAKKELSREKRSNTAGSRFRGLGKQQRREAARQKRQDRRAAKSLKKKLGRRASAVARKRRFAAMAAAARRTAKAGRKGARKVQKNMNRAARATRANQRRQAAKDARRQRRVARRQARVARRTTRKERKAMKKLGKKARKFNSDVQTSKPKPKKAKPAAPAAAKPAAPAAAKPAPRPAAPPAAPRRRPPAVVRPPAPGSVGVPVVKKPEKIPPMVVKKKISRAERERMIKLSLREKRAKQANLRIKTGEARLQELQQALNKRDAPKVAKTLREGEKMVQTARRTDNKAKRKFKKVDSDLSTAEKAFGGAVGLAQHFEEADKVAKQARDQFQRNWAQFQDYGAKAQRLFKNVDQEQGQFQKIQHKAQKEGRKAYKTFSKMYDHGKTVEKIGSQAKQYVVHTEKHSTNVKKVMAPKCKQAVRNAYHQAYGKVPATAQFNMWFNKCIDKGMNFQELREQMSGERCKQWTRNAWWKVFGYKASEENFNDWRGKCQRAGWEEPELEAAMAKEKSNNKKFYEGEKQSAAKEAAEKLKKSQPSMAKGAPTMKAPKLLQ